jgi:hypothetical protein
MLFIFLVLLCEWQGLPFFLKSKITEAVST